MAADSRQNNVAGYAIFTLQKYMHWVGKDSWKKSTWQTEKEMWEYCL